MKKIDLQSLSKHWAIEPTALQCLSTDLAELQSGLSLFAQKPLARTYTTTIRDGVAVVPVHGIITPRTDLFTILMGGTGLDTLAQDIQSALDNDDVQAILLDIDSPGGVAIGPSEMAEIIYDAGNWKPVWSYVGRSCCSATYWLASATQRIVAEKTAMLGSIGVVSSVAVQENADADGYKQIEIVSSNAKNKRPDPRTPEELDTIRSELDVLESKFIDAVASYRHVSVDTIKSEFGQGGVLIGNEAVEVGMADNLGTYESTIYELSQLTKKGEKTMDPQSITEEQIAAYRAEGAKAERERLLALDEMMVAGHEDLLAKAKQDPEMTAEKLAAEIIKAEKAKGQAYLASLKTAEETLPTVNPSANPTNNTGATPEERAEYEWNNNPEIRAEFGGDKAAFFAYRIAQENGQIKVLKKEE